MVNQPLTSHGMILQAPISNKPFLLLKDLTSFITIPQPKTMSLLNYNTPQARLMIYIYIYIVFILQDLLEKKRSTNNNWKTKPTKSHGS